MKKYLFFLSSFLFLTTIIHAQSAESAMLAKNHSYTGALATHADYHAIFPLDSNDPKIIETAIRYMNNALTDPRLTGKLQLELITFNAGTDVILKGSKYEDALKGLIQKGVIVAQCNNTLRQKKIGLDQVYDFVAVVPSANGELIIRQVDGWAIIKP